jgi:hypothetical protein
LTVLPGATYTVSFRAASYLYVSDFTVEIDGVALQEMSPTLSSFTSFSVQFTADQSSSARLTFRISDLIGYYVGFDTVAVCLSTDSPPDSPTTSAPTHSPTTSSPTDSPTTSCAAVTNGGFESPLVESGHGVGGAPSGWIGEGNTYT